MSFFQSLVDYIQAFFNYLINVIENLITVIKVVGHIPEVCQAIYGSVPAILATCGTVIIAVGICKLLVGWGNV